jgi:hypothetical protein
MDPNPSMGRRGKGRAITEAIGFVLILAVVIATISIYLIYLMPAMGRENEIAQMTGVKERFTEFKLNIDSLWTSRQCTSEYGPALSLGSGAETGILSFFPFFSPQKAGAVLALNQRAESITITSDSYFTVSSGGYNESRVITATPANLYVNTTPGNFYISVSTTDLQTQMGVLLSTPTWNAWVNITPNYFYANRFNWTLNESHYIQNFWNWTDYMLVSTDLTVSTNLGGRPIVTSLPVYRNISTLTVYTVDLMSPVYGISAQFQSPQTISASTSQGSGITATSDIRYGFVPMTSGSTQAMGSVEYRSNNLYYTPQTYYYQMGGVFLEQSDGSTNEIPPDISISMAHGAPKVDIGEILILGGIDTTEMSGSGPITVTSAVTDITRFPLPAGNNTRWVNLSIQAASVNAARMWNTTLTDLATQAGLPSNAYTSGTAGNGAFLNITGSLQTYDIQLSITKVNVSADYVNEYSPGGISRAWRNVPGYSPSGST